MSYSHEKFLIEAGFQLDDQNSKYSSLGKTYIADFPECTGTYWYYDTETYSVNIHDFIFHEEFIFEHKDTDDNIISISILKSASGEIRNPYKALMPHTVFSYTHNQSENTAFIMHKNIPFFSVGFEYKEAYLKNFIEKKYNIPYKELKNALQYTNTYDRIPEAEIIANQVLSYKGNAPEGYMFFDAKVEEVMSLVFGKYLQYQKSGFTIHESDVDAIETARKYIDDHYFMDIPQDFLCKITYMGKTKLKAVFKQIYGCTVTEYIQMKRVSYAEHMIINTDLNISDIAKAVGYNSASRFSKLFLQYKGLSPMNFRMLIKDK